MIARDIAKVGHADDENFGTIRSATPVMEFEQLVDPDRLVEIEADAILSS